MRGGTILLYSVHAACGGNATRSNHLNTTYNRRLYLATRIVLHYLVNQVILLHLKSLTRLSRAYDREIKLSITQ